MVDCHSVIVSAHSSTFRRYIVISAEVQTQIHAITYSFQFKPSHSLLVPPDGTDVYNPKG